MCVCACVRACVCVSPLDKRPIPYLSPQAGLWVVLPILGFAQQVGEHQRLERTRARGSGVAEGVHHAEVAAVAYGAE